MTRNKIEVEELLRALETIRAEQYPAIPIEVIRDIVLAQFNNQDNRAEGRKSTKKIIDDYLKDIVVDE
ncbi:DNA modification system-associated small protein [Paenibacillus lautus]|uniref:DNA modification system-associated small protein n=1 Tax=Paenibacillus lautus TaxID=1401 RepID=UPI000BBD721D|nr:DNA modification system-associated small protein [Paenibacillus lautus]PCL91878.1 hypothetical protein CPZ30_14105 [Paenibacillus lautus]